MLIMGMHVPVIPKIMLGVQACDNMNNGIFGNPTQNICCSQRSSTDVVTYWFIDKLF